MNHIIKNKIKAVIVLFSIILMTSCTDQERDFTGEALVTYPAVTVSSISPSVGTSGNVVTITGTNFGAYPQAAKIYFNGVLADEILTYTDTSVTVRVPQDAGTGPITVKVWTNQVTTSEFQYLVGATITNLSPTSAYAGDLLLINGLGFGTDISKVSVKFTNGITKYDALTGTVISVTDTQIAVKIPKGAVNGKVRVWLANQIITGPVLKIIAPPPGKYIFEFDDPTDVQWLPAQNGTYKIEDGKMKVTFDPIQFTGTNKRRADFYNIINSVFPYPGGTAKLKWVQSPSYPILAMKIAFTGTGAAKPAVGNISLDPAVAGGINAGNNKYKSDYIATSNVIYYDLSADYLVDTELATRQFKIADLTGVETGYEVDWVRTFKNVAELKAFLGQ